MGITHYVLLFLFAYSCSACNTQLDRFCRGISTTPMVIKEVAQTLFEGALTRENAPSKGNISLHPATNLRVKTCIQREGDGGHFFECRAELFDFTLNNVSWALFSNYVMAT